MKELSDIDIRHFKLSSGDEIITLVTEDYENAVVVSQPMQMHSLLNNNSQAYYFTDWQPMSKVNTCAISKLHIITFVECTNDVKEKYLRMCLEVRDENPLGSLNLQSDELLDDYTDDDIDEYLDFSTDDSDKTTYH